MIALYAEGMSTTMNLVITILEQGSSPNMTYKLMILSKQMKSPVNPISEDAIWKSSLVDNPSF